MMNEELEQQPAAGDWENPALAPTETPEEFQILGTLPTSIWDKI